MGKQGKQAYEEQTNIIQKTQQIIKHMNNQERLIKAQYHLNDALKYLKPRVHACHSQQSNFYFILHTLIYSYPFTVFLFWAGYFFMYLVILDQNEYAIKIILESSLLAIFWFQLVCRIYFDYHQKIAPLKNIKNFGSIIVLLLFMNADLIIFCFLPTTTSGRPIRPFRLLRVFIPMLYDTQIRKSFKCLYKCGLDILTFYIFYVGVIVSYALIGAKSLNVNADIPHDMYRQDYTSLSHMIFIIYVTATYDVYPDNQLLALYQSQWNNIYFLIFVFLNMFIFSSIPGSLIFKQFKGYRAIMMIEDEIKQQQSMIIVFTTLQDQQNSVSIQRLIQFLRYVYKNKIRYVQHITDICVSLCENRRHIMVNDFMHLTKIMLKNSYRLPPYFDDVQIWIKFRKYINDTFNLKQIISHWIFQLIVAIIIILGFINTIFLLFDPNNLVNIFDIVFLAIFIIELIIRIIGFGVQTFFSDTWNGIDALIVVMNLILQIAAISNNVAIFKLFRVFRLSSLIRIISHSNFLNQVNNQLYIRFVRLLKYMTIVFPIIIRYLPIFFLFYFFITIIAIEAFYSTYNQYHTTTPYNSYDKSSHFRKFVNGQFAMVQVLTEAGWSYIAMDLASQNAEYYGLVMIFFCFMHINNVFIIGALIKGIFWQTYEKVSIHYLARQAKEQQQLQVQQQNETKKKQYNAIVKQLDQKNIFLPDTILKKELYQNKIDYQILAKLLELTMKEQKNINRITSKRSIKLVAIEETIRHATQINRIESISSLKLINSKIKEIEQLYKLNDIDQLEEKDFQEQVDKIVDKILTNQRIKYIDMAANPKVFVDFLLKKFTTPLEDMEEQNNKFDSKKQIIYNQTAINSHMNEIKEILGIKASKRQKKQLIIQQLIEDRIITRSIGQKLQTKRLLQKMYSIEPTTAMRKVLLVDVDESSIKKIENQYFSQKYGHQFDKISRVQLQPFLQLQASLTYALRNILRYPQIQSLDFFQILSQIQNSISNNLLKKGSIAKFIYKIDTSSDHWFLIQYKKRQHLRIHFLKSGIWLYNKGFKQNDVYYAKDPFNFQDQKNDTDRVCKECLKKLFAAFEGISFSLDDPSIFFKTNPKFSQYDSYFFIQDAEKITRYQKTRFQISKIMFVVLSLGQQRNKQERLSYQLSDISSQQQKKQQMKISKRLQQIQQLNNNTEKQMIETQGLHYAYIMNMIREISELMAFHNKNMIFQIERAFNNETERLIQKYNSFL